MVTLFSYESNCSSPHSAQEMLNDVLGSVVSGRPVLRGVYHGCQPDPKNKTLLDINENIDKFINWDVRKKV